MKYDTLKVWGMPTPTDHLVVCDRCEKAYWTILIKGHTYHCVNCGARMRKGTDKEYQEANTVLEA